MGKFKPGDRVAVYGTDILGKVFLRGDTGAVSGWISEEVNVDLDDGTKYTFHEKQLRRLKKVKPRSVEGWMHEDVFNGDYGWTLHEDLDALDGKQGYIRVRVTEIKGKK